MKTTEMTFETAMHWIAQGGINISENDGEKFERGCPTHKAIGELCRMVNEGLVSLTPLGKKYETTEE